MLTTFTSRTTRIALTTVALGGLVAGCGSSSSNTSSPTSSSTSSSGSAGTASRTNRTALAACLRKHGVTLPSGGGADGAPPSGAPGAGSGSPPAGRPPAGGFPGGGANSSKFQAALKACGANFPAGRRPGGGISRQVIQNYATCVRQHGYNLPNPNFSGKGPVFPSNIRSNAKFQTASKACQSVLAPAGGGGGGSSG